MINQASKVANILSQNVDDMAYLLGVDTPHYCAHSRGWIGSGDKTYGDLLDLWCNVRSVGTLEAILEVEQWLGIGSTSIEGPGSFKSDDGKLGLAGWEDQQPLARNLIITWSAESQMVLDAFVPFEAGEKYTVLHTQDKSHDWIQVDFDKLCQYDLIYLLIASKDEEPSEIYELGNRLGRERCRIMRLPEDETNEYTVNREIHKSSIIDPSHYERMKHSAFRTHEYIYGKRAKSGYVLPWISLCEKVSFKPGQLSVWTGICGHGKSTMVTQIAISLVTQNARIAFASLEMDKYEHTAKLCMQACASKRPSPEMITLTHKLIGDNIINIYPDHLKGPLDIIDRLIFCKKKYNIDVAVIDSFMMCGIGEEDINAQKKFANDLCDFSKTYNVHIHLIAHPRKTKDEYYPVGLLDIKGSGGISDVAHHVFSVYRNIPKEDELSKHEMDRSSSLMAEGDCVLYCLKNRDGGERWRQNFWFDQEAMQYHETHRFKSKPLINYPMEKLCNQNF